jgi:hypothetical protein
MLKLTKQHTIYEVFNGNAAESVYIDHKPTWDEMVWLIEFNDWLPTPKSDVAKFIREHILVEKEQHMFTMTEKARRDRYHAERGED